ncbi:MAG TPA: hypothetical protein VJ901_22505 [Thermoanaerobaculia bacterium]|nr:hypothetical protein [Thermoanaerobaculia bacterium]
MSAGYVFSIAARDELWSGGVLIESRASHGRARCRGNEIDAVSIADPELIARSESRIASLREMARTHDGRVRIVASSRRVNTYERDESVITRPSPRRSGEKVAKPDEGLPLLWKNGSASVLLHEACGHAAEHGHQSIWPAWLTIHDEPDFLIDDANEPTRITDLTKESPSTSRRKSFNDIPLKRMTTLIARQHDAPRSLPHERIEIEAVDGGAYEPLTGIVTLDIVVADLVRGDDLTPLQPFRIEAHRERIAASIKGAKGDPLCYDGVVCSREGQELVVGSFAPLMLTETL